MKRESVKQRAERTYLAGLPGGLEVIALISRDAAASDRARRDVIAAAENFRTHGPLAFLLAVKAALEAEVSRENWPSHHAEEFTEGREALIDHVKRSYARLNSKHAGHWS